MGDYSQLTELEIGQIMGLYGVTNIESVKPAQLGISNSNYKVKAQDKNYLLKVSNDKGQEDLLQEIKILQFLQQERFPYSLCPFPTLEGGLVYQWQALHGVLFPAVDGVPPQIKKHHLEQLGEALGKLHQVKPVNPSLRRYQDIGSDFKTIRSFCQTDDCPSDYQDAFAKLNLEWPDDLEIGLMHGDFYYDNSLFAKDKLVTMIDFEQSGVGPLLLDLGIALSGSCLLKGEIQQELVNSYLGGYEKNRPLPHQEKTYLKTAILLGCLSISHWRLKRFFFGKLDPNRKNSYQELINRALSYAKT